MAHELPELPYATNALEPHIDARTMEIHHGKHHAAYVGNLNKAIAGKPELESLSIKDLCKQIKDLPSDIQTAVRNNVCGHFNHSLFWKVLSPSGGRRPERQAGGGESRPSSAASTPSKRSSPPRPRPASAAVGRGSASTPTASSASAAPRTRTTR